MIKFIYLLLIYFLIGFALTYLAFLNLKMTDSVFSDREILNNEIRMSRKWVPIIQMRIEFKEGNNRCIFLESDMGSKAKIFYEFSGDKELKEGGVEYSGECIKVSDGEWIFQAQAFNSENYDWKSDLILKKIKIEKNKIEIFELDNEVKSENRKC